MTVKELRHKLKEMNENAIVFVKVIDPTGTRVFVPHSEDVFDESLDSIYIEVFG